MRLDHLLSREEVGVVLLLICQGAKTMIPVAMRSGETPVPIPNTMVKTFTADGTLLETAWESRWLPDYKKKWGRSSVGRAPALQAGGQEFESLRLHCENQRFSQ